MKRLQVLSLVALSSTLLLFGCGNKEEEVIVEPVVEQVIDDISEPEEEENKDAEAEIDEDTPPEEGMVRSRITNEWVDEEVNNTRPITVMIPNTKTASQYGISQADVLYECNVEGSITRLMALFQDWRNFDRIGNVRSCRDYYIYWSFEWDAFYIHFGGPFKSPVDVIVTAASDIVQQQLLACRRYQQLYRQCVCGHQRNSGRHQ